MGGKQIPEKLKAVTRMLIAKAVSASNQVLTSAGWPGKGHERPSDGPLTDAETSHDEHSKIQ